MDVLYFTYVLCRSSVYVRMCPFPSLSDDSGEWMDYSQEELGMYEGIASSILSSLIDSVSSEVGTVLALRAKQLF